MPTKPRTTLAVGIRVVGLEETMAALKRLPKDAQTDLRQRTLILSALLATKVQVAARGDTAQSALMAPTVKARKGRATDIAVITTGGTTRVGRNRVPAFKILFGSEFGASRYRQFRSHLGRGSYWLFKTVEASRPEMTVAFAKIAEDIMRDFRHGLAVR